MAVVECLVDFLEQLPILYLVLITIDIINEAIDERTMVIVNGITHIVVWCEFIPISAEYLFVVTEKITIKYKAAKAQ